METLCTAFTILLKIYNYSKISLFFKERQRIGRVSK